MKRLPLFLLLLLLLTVPLFMGGCGEAKRESALPRPSYRIAAELDPAKGVLTVRTEIACPSPAEGLSAIKLRLYANAYREGNEVVLPEKYREAYGRSSASHGEAEITEITGDRPVTDYDLGQDGTILTVRLSGKYRKGETIRLTISERVTLAEIKHHLGRYNGYYYLAHFYPELCPFRDGKFVAHPVTDFGDPFSHECADFDLTLTLPLGYECAASAEAISREKQGGNATSHYLLKGARDFALVASKKLQVLRSEEGGIPLSYYYEKDTSPASTLRTIRSAIAFYAERFGDYAYPTYTVLLAPFCEAGAEHSAFAILSDTLSPKERETVVLHETAHQWWYGKVGNDEYASPWMDEGLAEYSVLYYYEEHDLSAKSRSFKDAAEDAYAIRLALEGSEGVRMDRPLDQLFSGYYERVYCGGLLLFSTLAERFGSAAFASALKRYATFSAGKLATPVDLISSLSASLGEDLSRIFGDWLTGKVAVQ